MMLPEGSMELSDGTVLFPIEPVRTSVPPYFFLRWQGRNGLRVVASVDTTPHGELLHVSVSFPDHDPDWDTLRRVQECYFGPDQDTMMVFPKVQDYVNCHPHCFHLWKTPKDWGVG